MCLVMCRSHSQGKDKGSLDESYFVSLLAVEALGAMDGRAGH